MAQNLVNIGQTSALKTLLNGAPAGDGLHPAERVPPAQVRGDRPLLHLLQVRPARPREEVQRLPRVSSNTVFNANFVALQKVLF